jgi:hypothetical protein
LARVNDLANGASAVWRDGLQEVSMIGNGWLQIAIFGAIVVAITKPFGFYMTRVFVGGWTPLSPLLRPVERPLPKLLLFCQDNESWRCGHQIVTGTPAPLSARAGNNFPSSMMMDNGIR